MATVTTGGSQSAFVRGFIDDKFASLPPALLAELSQSAFVRGFIDDTFTSAERWNDAVVSIRVRARLHR